MKKFVEDTIVALATPSGRGGIGVIRISGPAVPQIAKSLLKKFPKPRVATFTAFLDSHKNVIDEGLALYFPKPNSFTGEEVLELHGHGGAIVTDLLQKEILKLGARIARPGEFSERAFLNDKIDLVQAEAIADLIDAASEEAARSALRSLQGEFSKKIHALVDALIYLRTYVEAAIDFVEEEIDFLAENDLSHKLNDCIEQVNEILRQASQGSLLQEGITLVIAGKPNVGKSSLLNALSGTDAAIVTPIPGTTRDILREKILLDGLPIHVVDTAGLRESTDVVEQEGIRRATKEIQNADILLYMMDAQEPITDSNVFNKVSDRTPVLLVKNKIDLTNEMPELLTEASRTTIAISVKKQLGLELLKNHIKELVGFKNGEGTFSARRRHLDALEKAYLFLQNAMIHLQNRTAELLAEELRQAQLALNEITGEFTSEDLLGKIFGSFCIGK